MAVNYRNGRANFRKSPGPVRASVSRSALAKRGGKVTWTRGDHLPITASGLKSLWRRAKHRRNGATLPADLRFHDLRHDFATKLLRETSNIRLAQRALHHAKIETTTKYAHVLDPRSRRG